VARLVPYNRAQSSAKRTAEHRAISSGRGFTACQRSNYDQR
jgi:hypothetical protein